MSTPHRNEINRANSQHSTGPKTPEGKRRSSLNGLRHGFTGQLVVMPEEDLAAYELHLQSFLDQYQPQGAVEAHLVQALADCSWRLNRVAPLEANLLSISYTPRDLVDGLLDQAKALAHLSMHSQRLSRQFERTVAQLRDLQQTRRETETRALNDLLDIIEMYKDKGKTYDPSKDGFVFSEFQITDSIRRRNRERLIDEAYEHCSAA